MSNQYECGDLRENIKELQTIKGKGYLTPKRKLVQSRIKRRKR